MAFFMSVSMSDELQLFVQEIQSFLSSHILRDFARDVGFVQRTSKYQAKDLVAFCVWISQNVAMYKPFENHISKRISIPIGETFLCENVTATYTVIRRAWTVRIRNETKRPMR